VKNGPKQPVGFRLLSDFEREICSRFAAVRRFEKLTQHQMAARIHATRNQIGNIEAGRVPLKFWVGMNFCSEFNVNQLWLAIGTPPKAPYFVIDSSFLSPKPGEDALFSAVCLTQLGEILRTRVQLIKAVQFKDFASDFLARSYEDAFDKLLKIVIFEVPEAARLAFVEFIVKTTRDFISKLTESTKKKPLTDVTLTDNIPLVQSPMANLLDRLNKATSQRGQKTALAKRFGVPLANVSQWLSGEREPGGETTLRLLNWVEQQERQQRTPGSAINTAKGKSTRRKARREIKPSSSQ
jgi:transcriptional regulator with XRE-family HTH domain